MQTRRSAPGSRGLPFPTPAPCSRASPQPRRPTLSQATPHVSLRPGCRDPGEGQGRGWRRPGRRSVPEQGLLGLRRLVCPRAQWGLLGHLLVDAPGGHSDPQHGGQCGIVQQDAHLGGEPVSRPPRPAPRSQPSPAPSPAPSPGSGPSSFASSEGSSEATVSLAGGQSPRLTGASELQGHHGLRGPVAPLSCRAGRAAHGTGRGPSGAPGPCGRGGRLGPSGSLRAPCGALGRGKVLWGPEVRGPPMASGPASALLPSPPWRLQATTRPTLAMTSETRL